MPKEKAKTTTPDADIPADVPTPDEEKFKSGYTPDSSKWNRSQREFYNTTVLNAYRDGFEKGKLKQCDNSKGSTQTAADCGCQFCSGMLASAEKVKDLTGYDHSKEKPTR